MKRWQILFLAVSFIFTSWSAQAADGVRSVKKIGIFGQILGESFKMGGLGWNISRGVRLHGAYGSKTETYTLLTSSAETKISILDLGMRLMVPSWDFTPFIGVDYTSGDGTVTLNGTKYSISLSGPSVTFGLDWTLGMGLNLGAVIYAGKISTGGVYAGWYF